MNLTRDDDRWLIYQRGISNHRIFFLQIVLWSRHISENHENNDIFRRGRTHLTLDQNYLLKKKEPLTQVSPEKYMEVKHVHN